MIRMDFVAEVRWLRRLWEAVTPKRLGRLGWFKLCWIGNVARNTGMCIVLGVLAGKHPNGVPKHAKFSRKMIQTLAKIILNAFSDPGRFD